MKQKAPKSTLFQDKAFNLLFRCPMVYRSALYAFWYFSCCALWGNHQTSLEFWGLGLNYLIPMILLVSFHYLLFYFYFFGNKHRFHIEVRQHNSKNPEILTYTATLIVISVNNLPQGYLNWCNNFKTRATRPLEKERAGINWTLILDFCTRRQFCLVPLFSLAN